MSVRGVPERKRYRFDFLGQGTAEPPQPLHHLPHGSAPARAARKRRGTGRISRDGSGAPRRLVPAKRTDAQLGGAAGVSEDALRVLAERLAQDVSRSYKLSREDAAERI